MAKRRGNHEGSIARLPSGTYRALITLDGKRVTHTGKTRAECQGWILKMLDQIDEGLTYQGSQTTLGEFPRNGWSQRKLLYGQSQPNNTKSWSRITSNL